MVGRSKHSKSLQVFALEKLGSPTKAMYFPADGIKTFLFTLCVIMLSCAYSEAQVPASDHVFLLMLENHSYSQVVGNSSMPYLNSLIENYGVATNYDSDSHYSLPNYFWLTTGSYVTLDDGTEQVYDVDNVTRYLLAAGKTWKAYEESIPSAGYTGPTVEPYEKNHNPFAYLSDVVNSSEKTNIVPFTQLATDIANNALPNYALITPNSSHDGHSANLSATDTWLSTNLAPLLASPTFQTGGTGILIITFDESIDSDCAPLASCPKLPENGGGGHVATIVIGPNVKRGAQSATFYQHPSTLKTMLTALGISGAPGAASTAPSMTDMFVASVGCKGAGANETVTICTPSNNQSLGSPVHVTAATTDSKPVKYTQVYLDGAKVYQVMTGAVDTSIAMSAGTHRLTVQASDGAIFKTTIYVTVP
jgi:acid phosphatase